MRPAWALERAGWSGMVVVRGYGARTTKQPEVGEVIWYKPARIIQRASGWTDWEAVSGAWEQGMITKKRGDNILHVEEV